MLFANLPVPTIALIGTRLYTTDQNICYCNGTQWIPHDQFVEIPVDPVYTFATLPSITSVPVGQILYTSDQGSVENTGLVWNIISSSSSGSAVAFTGTLAAVAGPTQNNWNPAGLSATTNQLIVTTDPGDSIVTGIANPGWPNGWGLIIYVTATATGQFIAPALSGSSSVGNQFTAGVAIAPGFGGFFMFVSGVGLVPS